MVRRKLFLRLACRRDAERQVADIVPGARTVLVTLTDPAQQAATRTRLATVDFKALLTQMGKSISVASLQGGLEEVYPRALFGQDTWIAGDSVWNDRDDA